jgi:hypothetical protein
MMMRNVLVSVATVALASLVGLLAAPASAAPAPTPGSPFAAADVVQVQAGRPDGRRGGRDWDGDRRYTPGHRYHRAPSHWHRYHARPRDWRHRGCIIVGPVWFCP